MTANETAQTVTALEVNKLYLLSVFSRSHFYGVVNSTGSGGVGVDNNPY